MGKTLIMTDSGSDLTKKQAKKFGIRLLPFKYSFDGENYYKDGVDKTPEEFYEIERTSINVPKTVQITPVQFEEIYKGIYDEGYDHLIFVVLSGAGSGTCQNAVMVAKSFMEDHSDMHIEVIDSQAYTIIYGYAAIAAAQAVKEGKSAEEASAIIKRVVAGAKVRFIVGDLTHLKKGGRINAATLVVANMLDLKPILTLKDGLVVQDGKLRGTKNLYKKFVDDAVSMGDFEKGMVVIVNTCQPEKVEEMKAAIRERFPNIEIGVSTVGATIGSHAGPDLVGIAYFDEKIDVYADDIEDEE